MWYKAHAYPHSWGFLFIEEIISSPARFLPIPYCLSPPQKLHSIYCVLNS